jgi:hypothetical protein
VYVCQQHDGGHKKRCGGKRVAPSGHRQSPAGMLHLTSLLPDVRPSTQQLTAITLASQSFFNRLRATQFTAARPPRTERSRGAKTDLTYSVVIRRGPVQRDSLHRIACIAPSSFISLMLASSPSLFVSPSHTSSLATHRFSRLVINNPIHHFGQYGFIIPDTDKVRLQPLLEFACCQ